MIRTPTGHLSPDGRWFLERGGYLEGPRGGLDLTRSLWLIWERVETPAGETFAQTQEKAWQSGTADAVLRPLWEVTLDPRHDGDTTPYCHRYDAGSYGEARGLIDRIDREGKP